MFSSVKSNAKKSILGKNILNPAIVLICPISPLNAQFPTKGHFNGAGSKRPNSFKNLRHSFSEIVKVLYTALLLSEGTQKVNIKAKPF